MKKAQTVVYYDKEQALQGYVVYPDNNIKNQSCPIVLIAPDWRGHSDFVRDKARYIASLGYIGFVIDIYGDGKSGRNPDENAQLMQPFITDRLLLQQRLLAAYQYAKTIESVDSKRVAIMGYCFGGLCALDLARSGADIVAALSFHGLLMPPSGVTVGKIQAKVWVAHGYLDPMVPPQQLLEFCEEMKQAGVDWQIQVYGQALHAFTNPQAQDESFGTMYHQLTTERSEAAMEHFLQTVF